MSFLIVFFYFVCKGCFLEVFINVCENKNSEKKNKNFYNVYYCFNDKIVFE